MKKVPYHDNPGNACALACYTMIAQYLLPKADITFEQLGKVGGWRKGYVMWEFPIWKWLMDRGVYITDYDAIDYKTWARDGVDALKKSVPQKEFDWYNKNTYDLNEVTGHLQEVLAHNHFTFNQRKPTWEDIVAEYNKPGICDIVLNSKTLNREEGFAAHRVVLIEITDSEVIFHDPNHDGSGSYRHESNDHFRAAFEAMESPALARYSLTS
ncbi:MAG TPA: hypothetical protein VK674_04680 [Candidatus Limnocylindria bacterium]|nr:hypothetical protein [Candidatus Limnocylindria bacterium]